MRLLPSVLLSAVTLAGCAVGPKRPPNILLILADDLGYETLGANGGTSWATPRLDALAAGGMRFTQAYATPLCTPSRVELMTGLYGFRNYIGFGLLDPAARTFGHFLQQAGYRTAVAGKWQLYGSARQRELAGGRAGSLPAEAGFDESLLWQVEERGHRYKDPLLTANGEPARALPGGYGPDAFEAFIEDFCARHRDHPFFVYYPMVLTHDPFQPTPDHPDYAAFDPDEGTNDPRYFAANVAYMDELVGRIVQRLETLGLRDDTLILFVGDNGTDRKIVSAMGAKTIRGNKGHTNAAGTHVPMIASWPGTIAPGQVNDNLVDLTDFVPTLLDVVRAPAPPDVPLDGISFYPQLLGRADTVRPWVFCDYAPGWGGFEPRRFVHDEAWKLYDDGTFYDLRADPDELSPLSSSALPEEARRIRASFGTVLERLR